MKISADLHACRGHGQCEDAAPDVFEVDDDEAVVRLRMMNPPEALRPQVEDAVWRCPTDALEIVTD